MPKNQTVSSKPFRSKTFTLKVNRNVGSRWPYLHAGEFFPAMTNDKDHLRDVFTRHFRQDYGGGLSRDDLASLALSTAKIQVEG